MKLRRSRLAALLAAALALVPRAESSARTTLPSPQEPAKTAPAPPPAALGPLLAKAADYCRRLEASAFDFVCREEIAETIDPNLEIDRRMPPLPSEWNDYIGPSIRISRARKIKSTYVYDYQCVRAGRTIREVRTQLEENGKRKVVPNAELRTSVVVWGTALLAPAGIFAERFQPDYNFTVAGNDRIGADPGRRRRRQAQARRAGRRASLYGKAWIDPSTGDILKIEWSESRVGRFDIFAKRGQVYKRTPRLVIRSEFSAEKNGIRFPSRLSVEEAYLNERRQGLRPVEDRGRLQGFQVFHRRSRGQIMLHVRLIVVPIPALLRPPRPAARGPGLLLPRHRRPGGLPWRRLHGPGRRYHGPLLQSRRSGFSRRAPDQDEHELLDALAHRGLAGRRGRIHVLAKRARRELLPVLAAFQRHHSREQAITRPTISIRAGPSPGAASPTHASAKLNGRTFRTALAVEPLKGLAVSAALDVVSMSVDWDHRIPFELENYPLAHEILVMSQHEAGGNGIGFAAGALWKVFSGLQVGARFQKSASVDALRLEHFSLPQQPQTTPMT
ncbi:MAG: hypothetical protein MZU84_08255 [Sphingobacterium sp.]|nr:hypothetical protein [Sphingobacterium sp.]